MHQPDVLQGITFSLCNSISYRKFLQFIKPVKVLKIFDLFHQIEPVNETRNMIEKTLNKTSLIVFLENGNLHVGIPTSYDVYSNGVHSFDIDLIFSGHKKDGEINYHTNYLNLSKKVKRLFYLKNVASIGKFNYKIFLYFLDKKSNKNCVENEIIKQIKIIQEPKN